MKKAIFSFASFLFSLDVSAQNDSLQVAKTFKELLAICRNVDWADPNTASLGLFYKAAPYIVYMGEDVKRKYKDIADYSKPDDKKGVDFTCRRINNMFNTDTTYKIVKYLSETQSEGKWYVLFIEYTKRGQSKHAAFAFLKIKNKFVLGDID